MDKLKKGRKNGGGEEGRVEAREKEDKGRKGRCKGGREKRRKEGKKELCKQVHKHETLAK